MDRELLIEIGCEELPASWLPGLTAQFKDRLDAKLVEFRLSAGVAAEPYSTPRRLAARVPKIAERQEDLEETVTGPPVSAAVGPDGQPTKAGLGFAQKQGVEFAALARVDTPKGQYVAYHKRVRGRAAADVLPQVLAATLRDLAFPRQMHWDALLDDGRGELLFGRPIRWILFLYGGRVVPFTIVRSALARGPHVQDVVSAAATFGHRFLATTGRPGRAIKVRSFDEYAARLAEHFVVLDRTERRERLTRELDRHARKLGGRVFSGGHATLLEEVPDLVEYPAVVVGFFDPSFLDLPEEVLATTMIHHQHFFPVVDDRGRLKEAFLAVVNVDPQDERAIARNAERVLAARLRDARFFWDADRRIRLEDRLGRLETVTFHKKLGSYRHKADRIERLAGWIAEHAFGRPEDAGFARTAARLAKADLTTDMVREFTELQGTMGGIYAREEGQPEQVWKAVYYQYLPIGVEADAPPTRDQLGAAAVSWAAVSLADKLDTVAGFASVGEKVTGSRDPYGVRRQLQGVVRILVDLPELTGLQAQPTIAQLVGSAGEGCGVASEDWARTIFADYGIAERVRHLFRSRGFTHGEVNAVVPLEFDGSPYRARLALEALRDMRQSADLRGLAVVFKRVKNIAKELTRDVPLDRAVLSEPAEGALVAEIDKSRPAIQQASATGEYRRAFTAIAALRPALDRFFTEVFVMVDDARLRQARLKLMAELRDMVLTLADISEIVPETES
jgi:glycyl-tRNA synthetase beta chain